MKQQAWDALTALATKWGFVAISVITGAITQVLIINSKEDLTLKQIAAIFFSGSIVGGSYGYWCVLGGYKVAACITGVITLTGYNITAWVIAASKDPAQVKAFFVDSIKRLLNIK